MAGTELQTVTDKAELEMLEEVIESGLQTFVEVGNALLVVREKQLYRKVLGYQTFEEYCRERWSMGRRYANMIIAASGVVSNLGTLVPILPTTEKHARPLTSLLPEQQREVWKQVIEETHGNGITAAKVEKAVKVLTGQTTNVHVSDDSYEWYTPPEYIETVRQVLGSIDIDPASSAKANEVIQASRFYTKEEDGRALSWFGNVYLNPPYSMPEVEEFASKAVAEWQAHNLKGMIVLTNNSTDTGWFHLLGSSCDSFCFTRRRVGFWKDSPQGETLATRQGQVFFYFGKDKDRFAQLFNQWGLILERGAK